MKYLMGCGHVSNAIGANNNPVCAICYGIKRGADIIIAECLYNYGLENRKSKCIYCGELTNSNWDLPFFKYCPQKEYDEYMCGCIGWD